MPTVKNTFKLSSKVYLYPGMAGWHFIGVPKKENILHDDVVTFTLQL